MHGVGPMLDMEATPFAKSDKRKVDAASELHIGATIKVTPA